ncbi:MAG: DUF4111 domain-containing protein [Anaerolineae bacterium]
MSNFAPTPYSDVNAILLELLTAVQSILGSQFIGLYLYGSLALDAFNPHRSDIDFVVVTTDTLADEAVAALAAMHAQIAASDSRWAIELEGAYIPLAAMRRYDSEQAWHPHIDRGHDEQLHVKHLSSDWIIQRYVLREHGLTLAGPPIRDLIDPVSPDSLRQATRDILHNWWQPMLTDPQYLDSAGYRVYAVLTMCRMMYTLQVGGVVSKPAGVRWALGVVDGPFDSAQRRRFTSLIQQADTWQNGMPFDKLAETLDFIGYVVREA